MTKFEELTPEQQKAVAEWAQKTIEELSNVITDALIALMKALELPVEELLRMIDEAKGAPS
jgi:hypothetical protein